VSSAISSASHQVALTRTSAQHARLGSEKRVTRHDGWKEKEERIMKGQAKRQRAVRGRPAFLILLVALLVILGLIL